MAKKKVTKKKSRPTARRATSQRAAQKRTVTKKTTKKRPDPGASVTQSSKKTAAAETTVKKKPARKESTARSTKSTATKAPSRPSPSARSKKSSASKASSSSKRRSARGARARLGSSSVAEAATAASADAQGYVFINGRRVRMITTRKVPAPTKKPRTEAASSVPMEPEPKARKPIKSRLSPKTLNEYRTLLLIKRAELVGDLSAMEAKALRSDGGNLSNVPIHMADIGSDTYDQDFMLGLAETERARLREIDEALLRIDDRTYGVCQMTGKVIPKARLAAKPWAKYTIEAAREVEAGWGS